MEGDRETYKTNKIFTKILITKSFTINSGLFYKTNAKGLAQGR